MTDTKASLEIQNEIQNEIKRLVTKYGYNEQVLNEFARFILCSNRLLTLPEIKQAIYKYFDVNNTKSLRNSSKFRIKVSSLGSFDLRKIEAWETLYRNIIGILPHEKKEIGYGCINGINIFKYDLPWKVFGLDPKIATKDDIRSAYHSLSKIYHTDNSKTGDAAIFNRLTIFYESLTDRP